MKVRDEPCGPCPITRDGPDPECMDIREFIDRRLMPSSEAIYICAWSKSGERCKGAAEYFKTRTGEDR